MKIFWAQIALAVLGSLILVITTWDSVIGAKRQWALWFTVCAFIVTFAITTWQKQESDEARGSAIETELRRQQQMLAQFSRIFVPLHAVDFVVAFSVDATHPCFERYIERLTKENSVGSPPTEEAWESHVGLIFKQLSSVELCFFDEHGDVTKTTCVVNFSTRNEWAQFDEPIIAWHPDSKTLHVQMNVHRATIQSREQEIASVADLYGKRWIAYCIPGIRQDAPLEGLNVTLHRVSVLCDGLSIPLDTEKSWQQDPFVFAAGVVPARPERPIVGIFPHENPFSQSAP